MDQDPGLVGNLLVERLIGANVYTVGAPLQMAIEVEFTSDRAHLFYQVLGLSSVAKRASPWYNNLLRHYIFSACPVEGESLDQ